MLPIINKNYCIIFAWMMMAFICSIYLHATNNPFQLGSITDPYSESSLADDTLNNHFSFGKSRLYVLYSNDNLLVQDNLFKQQLTSSLAGLNTLTIPHRVISPYEQENQIALNKRAAYATIVFEQSADDIANSLPDIRHALGNPAPLHIMLGGQAAYTADVNKLSADDLLRGEFIALPICLIILVLIFRGVVAALLPVITGVICTTIILAILYFIGHYFEISIFVLNIATILSLAVSLDYSLLITYRFREELAHGHASPVAMQHTLRHAGRAILFSGLTVLISMGSLLFFPINLIFTLGLGGMVVIIVTCLSSLTLLPAMLSLLGNKVDLWSVALTPVHTQFHLQRTLFIMRHPITVFLAALLFLLFLGYPFLHVKLNRSDAKILPTWTESRQQADAFSHYFNPNELTPIEIVFTSKQAPILSAYNLTDLYDFVANLKSFPSVDNVHSLFSIHPGMGKYQYIIALATPKMYLTLKEQALLAEFVQGNYTALNVISRYPANDVRSLTLVRDIRNSRVGADVNMQITGNSASIIDSIQRIYHLFFIMIMIITLLTYLLLLVLLRSLILPLKAILMNYLSLSICFGMLVFVFQEGHFSSLLNFTAPGYIDLNLPILLFFSLFGISMDYEVFLLTRIQEIYLTTQDNDYSVAHGIDRSARIIISAALLVIIVTASFVTADIIFVKAFSLGITFTVFVDATIIRLILVPATMKLLGRWNWYYPQCLVKRSAKN